MQKRKSSKKQKEVKVANSTVEKVAKVWKVLVDIAKIVLLALGVNM